ncbi:MAG TPA: flagellar hook-associated protein FlgK [Acidobacteriaceae bacterium]|nr:flagellar hook-associated protein FlgK [Acidobacteriaceae bacterium]
MGGLNATLNIGVHALDAAQAALDATSNNISNVNTPGYTEEVVQLSEAPLNQSGNDITGGGVTMDGIQSVRDELLNLQIQQQTSAQSSANTKSASLQQIQTYFTTTGTDITSALTAFSTSLAALSATPASTATQQSVLSAGQDLAQAFNTTANGLTSAQSSANDLVTTSVAQINTLTHQIAQLNGQMEQLTNSGQNVSAVDDQLNAAVQQLSGLTGISVTQSKSGDTILTGNGTPLVMGDQNFKLQTTTGSDGFQQVLDSNGTNITSTLKGGQLGGAIQMRDQTLPGMLSQLNALASQFSSRFNSAQAQGLDSKGNPGQNFFAVPTDPNEAASGMTVSISDPSMLAINSVGTGNSNSNVANLSAVLTQALPSNSASSAGGTPSIPLATGTALTNGSVTSISDASTGQTFTFTAGASSTIASLQSAIASAVAAGTLSNGIGLSVSAAGYAVISTTTAGDTLQVSTNDGVLGQFTSTSGKTPANAYASLVFDVGNAASNVSTQYSALSKSLLQLTNQQSSVSGVNIDDETANLIRFQTAYQAAARIVSTIQQLDTVTLDMGSTQSY